MKESGMNDAVTKGLKAKADLLAMARDELLQLVKRLGLADGETLKLAATIGLRVADVQGYLKGLVDERRAGNGSNA